MVIKKTMYYSLMGSAVGPLLHRKFCDIYWDEEDIVEVEIKRR